MKKFLFILLLVIGLIGTVNYISKTKKPYSFPKVNPKHRYMNDLLENAMGFINPVHGLSDPVSGYPVEGWNHDPEKGLYLRSFTQLTSIGEWAELMANIAAGYADNPYISREQSLQYLKKLVQSLRNDQQDPGISAKGLLGNFLGLEKSHRLGPLTEDVEKQKFIEAFGPQEAENIWKALVDRKWIVPQGDGRIARVDRKDKYGSQYFDGVLEKFSEIRHTIMNILDARAVRIIFGDNVNLTASLAKSIGALLHPNIKDHPQSIELRNQIETFIEAQKEGYEYLYDKKTDTFIFGWNATRNQFTGWDDGQGNWVVGHMNLLVNEFRGPFMFVVERFGLPEAAIQNAGIKIKPYTLQNGQTTYALATWDGSAFQAMGLSLFMGELEDPAWRTLLKNLVDIEIDYATRYNLPGFLSESYTGNGSEYEGACGIPDIAITEEPRITNAPSIYTLGVAYMIAPQKIENFLSEQWTKIQSLFTDHGPWEGYHMPTREPIRYQTSGHVLSLILGGINSASENMRRYLGKDGLPSQPGKEKNLRFRDVRTDRRAVPTFTFFETNGVDLSGGKLTIYYRCDQEIPNAVVTLERTENLSIVPPMFPNEIYTRFENTQGAEKRIILPFPPIPGLKNIQKFTFFSPNKKEHIFSTFQLTKLTFKTYK